MTIAEQLKVTEFPFEIWDSRGNKIYVEFVNKFWVKREFNSRGSVTYYEDSKGYWLKREYDSNNNEIYSENSNNFWQKSEYDSRGNMAYFENSEGLIVDNRPKSIPEYTMEELIKIVGKEFKVKK